jgi:threonine dehydrogenase-like Zn-dependent dehydrogenase
MVDTMRAERFYADSKTIAVEDIPIPEPGAGEVLVKVAFCGICHSDLSLINSTFPPQQPVVTQGHEASGTIAKLGPDVTGWAEGDRVIVAAGRPCMTCPNCRRGDVANCQRIQLMAFAYDGAWAEYTVAQAVGLTRVPNNVPLEQAAILADAVSTPFGAVVRTGRVGIGESVGVWGVGGVGTHIVQRARLVGAVPVIAVDINPAVLDRALELGADHALDPSAPGLHLGEGVGHLAKRRGHFAAFLCSRPASSVSRVAGVLSASDITPPLASMTHADAYGDAGVPGLGLRNVDTSSAARRSCASGRSRHCIAPTPSNSFGPGGSV